MSDMSDTEERLYLEGVNRLAFKSGARLSRACAQCVFSAKEGKDRVCRLDPPKVHLFMMPVMAPPGLAAPGRQGGGFQVISQTAFPVVRDDQWCGKFESQAS